MRVWTNTKLSGVWLNAIAVVVADNAKEAAEYLEEDLKAFRLEQPVNPDDMELLLTQSPRARILFNGAC